MVIQFYFLTRSVDSVPVYLSCYTRYVLLVSPVVKLINIAAQSTGAPRRGV